MKEEYINTANGTTASLDPSVLPVPLETPVKRQPSHLADSRGRAKKRAFSASSLNCLESVDLLSIEVNQSCWTCRFDKHYSVRDVNGDRVILKGVQDYSLFNGLDGLKNVIIRDQEDLPVARVCFKQKSSLYSSLVLAVYAPYDVLAGTGEETSGIFMLTSKLLLRNSDGDDLFIIEYVNNLLNSHYQIKSKTEESETVAKIVTKSRHRLSLRITTKMSIVNKLILIGYCIAQVNKFTPPNKPVE